MRPTAYIFGIQQCLLVLYINPANQAFGVQTGTALGVKSFHKLIMGKTLKIIFAKAIRPSAYISSMWDAYRVGTGLNST